MTKQIAPTLITSISKDELLPFYFVRVAERAYHNCHPQTWYAPSRLDSILETFLGTGGGFAQMKAFNTFLPLQSRFLTPDDVGVVTTHAAKKPVHGIMAVLGMNGPNGGWAKTIPSFCIECLKEDIALCGAPFWNRTNLVPGLLFCSMHGRPLSSAACENCFTRYLHPNHNSRPGLHCGCGIAPLPGSTDLSSARQEQELELHRVTRKLLDPTYLRGFTRDTLSHAIKARSEQLGLVQGTALNASRVEDFFNGHPWRPVFERVKILAPVKSIPEYLTGKLIFRNPLQSCALAHGLFGDWSSVESAIDSPKNHAPTINVLKKKTYRNYPDYMKNYFSKNRDSLFLEYSEKYSRIRDSNENFTHTDITTIIGKNYKKILNKETLHQAGIAVPFYKLTVEKYKQLDIDVAATILDKSDELAASKHSGRISVPMLLEGFGYRKYRLLKGHTPFADAALKLCCVLKQPRPVRAKPERCGAPPERNVRPGTSKVPVLIESLVQVAPPARDIVEADSTTS